MYSEKVNAEIPYQRALILFDKGRETLALQSQYQIPGTPGNHTIGWVVPVPAVPEIASMKAGQADWLFGTVDMMSHPRYTNWSLITILSAIGLGFCIGALSLLASFTPLPTQRKSQLRRLAFASFSFIILGVLIGPMFIRQSKGAHGVEVLKSGKVGIFDTKVIRSDSPKELIAWLKGNSFQFNESDENTIRSYLDRKWCFVTAKVDANVAASSSEAVSRKLLAPLILNFPTPHPVYPTALTATAGHSTEILVYLVAKEPMKTSSALVCKFRGEVDGARIISNFSFIEPVDFEDYIYRHNVNYLSKFKATLSPTQMERDIEFLPDSGALPYREHVHRW